ncbi:Sterol regulatory element-binding cleavage-activating [Hyphodiscus hymeniophilus]|uniref:Sterol regulatory element-binding protein cleavage-activating protein n=1 Tax=Hyphodiscus hymeniophilus TaxID=353542 RepID=A0A9P6VHX6_9HELO|nr:Sterol regulatory element-binding cleavage-activating [Hyphodiscus hymeniophilus]
MLALSSTSQHKRTTPDSKHQPWGNTTANPLPRSTTCMTMLIEPFIATSTAAIVWAGKVADSPASMIWYLLYPFRGTTEPPVLDAKHPIRTTFTQYGYRAARHPVIVLLISVATAATLIYPFPFLYTNSFMNGASNLPHHVWTSAQPFEGDYSITPDVVMRSIWVHGSYMKALQPHVLEAALEIQDELLGSTQNFDPRRGSKDLPQEDSYEQLTPEIRDQLHAVNGLRNSSWFFHSPLQYWSCSRQNIAEDQDILSTVNEGSRLSTSVNVTLRHSIVFSGKRFEDHRLIAADALVVTLIHMLDSPVGRHWERKAQEIALQKSAKWRLYPPDGQSVESTLYEFRFQPLNFQDDLFLATAYSLTALYFAFSLSKLRALKSRIGLILAVVSQIAVSIMSSFTICAILKIDLSKIPRETYPLVILTVGLENIFRLINAVIMTPSQAPTASRMSDALGKTGHVALAGVTQNLLILWMLTKMVSPGVAAFCKFAAIALTFDFFYLLTFFLAVLSVDVRRTELRDSLNRSPRRASKAPSPEHQSKQTWADAILHGDAPVSTRVAGTVVMVSFIIAAQWHFFDNESILQTISRFLRHLRSEPQRPRQSPVSLLSVDVNQARTPTAWLQMQDHETAHEVIQVIKPHAHSYIARVYDPLVFVLDGSDRTSNRLGVRRFLPAFYDFARHQTTPFIITVFILVAAVSLLMNYLLWDEVQEDEEEERPKDRPLISVKSLNGHALDIVLLSASSEGIVASVGLDRWIRVWNVRPGGGSYLVGDPDSEIDPFPVLAMAIDSDSNWLAILSAKDMVVLWNIPERRWGLTATVAVKGRTPAAFFFGDSSTELINPVIIVRHNGLMTELHMESSDHTELRICRSPLVCARAHFEKAIPPSTGAPPRIITSSKSGCVHIASKTDAGWTSVEVPCDSNRDSAVLGVLPLAVLNSFLAIRNHSVELIDTDTHRVTNTFDTKPMKPNTLRCFHSSRRRPQCGSVGLGNFALAYTSAEGDECILQFYQPKREGDTICFRDPYTPGSKTCCIWTETVEQVHTVQNPGDWEALAIGHLVGIRKCESAIHSIETSHHTSNGSVLRRRGPFDRRHPNSSVKQESDDDWEVWSLSARGEQTTTPLSQHRGIGNDHLLVGGLGPIEKVGKRSLAVGLGNVVKVIAVGNERFDSVDSGSDEGAFVGMKSSRRKRSNMSRRRNI